MSYWPPAMKDANDYTILGEMLGLHVNITGNQSRKHVCHAINMLLNLEHWGDCIVKPTTGDAAGSIFQLPHLERGIL